MALSCTLAGGHSAVVSGELVQKSNLLRSMVEDIGESSTDAIPLMDINQATFELIDEWARTGSFVEIQKLDLLNLHVLANAVDFLDIPSLNLNLMQFMGQRYEAANPLMVTQIFSNYKPLAPDTRRTLRLLADAFRPTK
jgi:hypothetical protein